MQAEAQRAHEAEAAAIAEPTELVAEAAADAPAPRSVHAGLLAAALVVIVGASAIAMGALSTRSGESSAASIDASRPPATVAALAPEAVSPLGAAGDVDVAAASDVETRLAARIHGNVAHTLPRIQAATATGMREGSGLFITADGHLITSAALVSGSDYVLAWTHDGRRWPAVVIATDLISDVALLAIDAPTEAAPFSQDTHLWSGQYAMAIDHGNRTMSLGQVESLIGATDVGSGDPSSRVLVAPQVLPGSAIVDDTGAVIAMVNLTQDETARATPAWMLERVVGQLLHEGQASHPWLGAMVEFDQSESSGHISAVHDDSPAASAGLQVGDIIDSVNGEPLSTNMSIWTMVQMRTPGEVVDLAVTRHGQRRLVQVTLGSSGP